MTDAILPPIQETSIAFQTNKTPSEYRELATLVNRYGFDVVSVYGDMPYQSPIGPLTIMAPHLERARIGTACISPSRFSPIDMAGDTALLDHLTNGRAYLGIARGAWLERHGIREIVPAVTAFRECIQIIRHLWSGEAIPLGKLFTVAESVALPYPRLRTRIPILVGTWGPKLGRLAGELADEVKIGGGANPAMIPIMRGFIAEGEKLAGRVPDSVGIAIGAVTVVDEDSRAAKHWVKRDLALYLPVVAGLDVTVKIDPDLLKRIGALVDMHQIDDAAALISDDLLSKFAIAGSPDEVLEHAQALYDAGARRVEFGTPHGLRPGSGIQLLGERVIPHLQLAR